MAAPISPQPLVVGEMNQTAHETTTNPNQSYADHFRPKQSNTVLSKADLFPVTFVHGEPTVEFSIDDINQFTKEEGLHQAVIMKFSYGKPDLQEFRKVFSSQFNIQGRCNIGLLEFRHVLVRFDLHNDFVQCISKSTGYVKAKGEEFFFRTFPWTMGFNPKEETSLAVVWISFPSLSPNFFAKRSLMSIASAVGKPISVDKATQDRTRPSAARVKVILDLLDKHPKKIKIVIFDRVSGKSIDLYQEVVYDNLPKYCTYCKHQGHYDEACRLWKEKGPEEMATTSAPAESNLPVIDVSMTDKLHGDARKLLNQVDARQAAGVQLGAEVKKQNDKAKGVTEVPKEVTAVENSVDDRAKESGDRALLGPKDKAVGKKSQSHVVQGVKNTNTGKWSVVKRVPGEAANVEKELHSHVVGPNCASLSASTAHKGIDVQQINDTTEKEFNNIDVGSHGHDGNGKGAESLSSSGVILNQNASNICEGESATLEHFKVVGHRMNRTQEDKDLQQEIPTVISEKMDQVHAGHFLGVGSHGQKEENKSLQQKAQGMQQEKRVTAFEGINNAEKAEQHLTEKGDNHVMENENNAPPFDDGHAGQPQGIVVESEENLTRANMVQIHVKVAGHSVNRPPEDKVLQAPVNTEKMEQFNFHAGHVMAESDMHVGHFVEDKATHTPIAIFNGSSGNKSIVNGNSMTFNNKILDGDHGNMMGAESLANVNKFAAQNFNKEVVFSTSEVVHVGSFEQKNGASTVQHLNNNHVGQLFATATATTGKQGSHVFLQKQLDHQLQNSIISLQQKQNNASTSRPDATDDRGTAEAVTAGSQDQQAKAFGDRVSTEAASATVDRVTTEAANVGLNSAGLAHSSSNAATSSATASNKAMTKSNNWTEVNKSPSKKQSPGVNQIGPSNVIGVSNSFDVLVNEGEHIDDRVGQATAIIPFDAQTTEANNSNTPKMYISSPHIQQIINETKKARMMNSSVVKQPLVTLNTSMQEIPSQSVESFGEHSGDSGHQLLSTGNNQHPNTAMISISQASTNELCGSKDQQGMTSAIVATDASVQADRATGDHNLVAEKVIKSKLWLQQHEEDDEEAKAWEAATNSLSWVRQREFDDQEDLGIDFVNDSDDGNDGDICSGDEEVPSLVSPIPEIGSFAKVGPGGKLNATAPVFIPSSRQQSTGPKGDREITTVQSGQHQIDNTGPIFSEEEKRLVDAMDGNTLVPIGFEQNAPQPVQLGREIFEQGEEDAMMQQCRAEAARKGDLSPTHSGKSKKSRTRDRSCDGRQHNQDLALRIPPMRNAKQKAIVPTTSARSNKSKKNAKV